MSHLSADVLSQAIESEIHARELYRSLSEKITFEDGKDRMVKLSAEEEQHRQILSELYKRLFKKDYEPAPGAPSGPDFALLQASTYEYTDLFEVIRLAIGAEAEAAAFYTQQLASVSDPAEVKMLKYLVRFEKSHQRKLEKELRRLTRKYS
jgi:rubrerythrin